MNAISSAEHPEADGCDWGRRIRQACLRRGLSRGALAARSGVSRTTLYQLERGGVVQPRATTLKRIADALDVDVAWLTDSDGSNPNDVDRRRFDRATNPAVHDVYQECPSLFVDWSATEWDELYSTFGTGGQLTAEGVVQTAVHINRKREVGRRLNVLLETHLGDVAAGLVDTLYNLVSAAGNGTATRNDSSTG